MSKFKNFTANDWSYINAGTYKRVSRKLTVVPFEIIHQNYTFSRPLKLFLQTNQDTFVTKLHSLILTLFNVKGVEELLPRLTDVDLDVMPLTRLNEANLLKAQTISERLADSYAAIKVVQSSNRIDLNHLHFLYEEIFLHIAEIKKILPFTNRTNTSDHIRNMVITNFTEEYAKKMSDGIQVLTKVKTMTEILLGAM